MIRNLRATCTRVIFRFTPAGGVMKRPQPPITASAVADRLGITADHVCLIARRLKMKRLGRDWMFFPGDVQRISDYRRPLGRPPKDDFE
jgi:hypothetical protein